jgi:hypothetical protein
MIYVISDELLSKNSIYKQLGSKVARSWAAPASAAVTATLRCFHHSTNHTPLPFSSNAGQDANQTYSYVTNEKTKSITF